MKTYILYARVRDMVIKMEDKIIDTEFQGIKKLKKIKRRCVVLNVAQAKAWRNVIVKDLKTEKKFFFGKVINSPPEINIGDELYIGYEDLPYSLPGKKYKITLMTLDGYQLDWTIV